MIDVIPLSACHTEQYGTISVTSLLSFNNYFDPRNAAFGSLLVFNDYRVPPASLNGRDTGESKPSSPPKRVFPVL